MRDGKLTSVHPLHFQLLLRGFETDDEKVLDAARVTGATDAGAMVEALETPGVAAVETLGRWKA